MGKGAGDGAFEEGAHHANGSEFVCKVEPASRVRFYPLAGWAVMPSIACS